MPCSYLVFCTERPNELATSAPLQVYPTHQFTYDRVFGPGSQQAEVYEHAARGAVLSTLQVLVLNKAYGSGSYSSVRWVLAHAAVTVIACTRPYLQALQRG